MGSRLFHHRKHCPAMKLTCYCCGKKGYFSKVSLSRPPDKWKFVNSWRRQAITSAAAADSDLTNFCTVSAACPASFTPASLQVSLNETNIIALVGSGNSESYINSRKCSDMKRMYTPLHTKFKWRKLP